CALSYCWGGPQPSQTIIMNFRNGRKKVAIFSYPRAITDAIVVASRFKIPYLWVHSMCFVQDDAEDIRRELAYMPKIYKHSILTLVASVDISSCERFLRPR
ncbi:hypothetical protein K469DRAFT_526616, partial [Zopfia rhizophila CBS 207.26]